MGDGRSTDPPSPTRSFSRERVQPRGPSPLWGEGSGEGACDRFGEQDDMNLSIPKRIVSLACSNTEILFALGLGAQVVGVDDWSDFPPQVGGLPRVGPDLGIDMAKVAGLEPDLILASLSVPGMERNIPALERLGVPFLVLDPKSLHDVFGDIERVG